MAKPPGQRKSAVPKSDRKETDKDPELQALGRRVCELREAAGMTQESLAQAAGLHWTYIGQIERGERNLTYKSLLKVAHGLGVETAELLPKA